MTSKHVWKVTGEWPPLDQIDEGWPPGITVRHYLTKQAARRRAQVWLEGREYDDREPQTNAPITHVVPPALSVVIQCSQPIVFEASA